MAVEEEAAPLFQGAPILVRGLASAAQYNGCKGFVTGGPWDNGRYEVTIRPEGEAEPKVLALKPGNVQLDVVAMAAGVSARPLPKRNPPLEDVALFLARGRGLSSKALAPHTSEVPSLAAGQVLLRVEKFAFSQMSIGYLMKGFTRTFAGYHNFFPGPEENLYMSGVWGFATVAESRHERVPEGTRLYGFLPLSRYLVKQVDRTVPPGVGGPTGLVDLGCEDVPYQLHRYQEYEVVPEDSDPGLEDWKMLTKELYTNAFWVDELLVTDCGMVSNAIISCASSKTAISLAFVMRTRADEGPSAKMRHLVGLTSPEHVEFVRSLGLYSEVLTYDDVSCLPEGLTSIYVDFKCDAELRQRITLKLGTNLTLNLVVGPAMFQKRAKDQQFEKRANEKLFNADDWLDRRKILNTVTKTGRNEKLVHSYSAFIERARAWFSLRHLGGVEALRGAYERVCNNTCPPGEAYVCSMHEEEFKVEEIWSG